MHSCNCSKGCRFGCHREADDKGRSFRVQVVVTHNLSAMFADNAIANTQAQTGTLANVLGGKERIKNTFGIGDAHAVIAKRNLDERAAAGAPDLNAGGPPGFADSVVSIVQYVEKHLLELVGISDDRGQRFVEAFDHLNAVTDEVVRAQVQRALQDGGEGIVDFVGDAGDQLSDGRHFLGVHELGSQDGGVGDIGHDYDDVADLAVFSADGAEIDGELAAGTVAANQWQIKVIDLLAAGHGCQCFAECGAARRGAQVRQGMPQDLVLLKAETAPAPVGIT